MYPDVDLAAWEILGEIDIPELLAGATKPDPQADPELLKRVNRYRARFGQKPLRSGDWSVADLREFASHIRNPKKQESLFSVEEEGFALVSPKGTYEKVTIPKESQERLLGAEKPDAAKMLELRERELAERAARKGPKKRKKNAGNAQSLKRRLMR